MKLRALAVLACTAAVFSAAVRAAEPFPVKPVTIVVPFPPGGGADILARVIGQKLSETWSQPVVIETKPGAAGVLGAGAVARSPADGYTLLMAAGGAVTPENMKDLAPVTLVSAPPYLLAVSASMPVSSVKELIALAKAKPGAINFASSGPGSASHLAAELFMSMSQTNMTHVPYKGIGQAVNDLVAGTVTVMFGPPPPLLAHVQSGKLKALAVTGAERSPLFRDLPTVAEAGVPGYEAVGWYGILAPAKTPRDIVARVAEETARALRAPAVQERLAGVGATPVGNSPEQFARFLEADIAKSWDLMRKAGVAPQ
jgi:tripartite-type tricarboxylate transporter receptor subunit TctC